MKIRNQLFLIFLTVGITVILLVSLIIYHTQKKIILKHVFNNLEAISQTKTNRLKELIKDRYTDLELIAEAPLIIKPVNLLLKTGNIQYEKDLNLTLKHYSSVIRSFNKIHVLSNEGIIISSSDSSYLGKDLSRRESFQMIKKNKKYMGGYFSHTQNKLILTCGCFIQNKSGIVLIELQIDDFIEITNDYTGLGKTGETVIATKHPAYLTPTRFHTNSIPNIKPHPNSINDAMNLALEGKEGLFTKNIVDYRGEEVIASIRFIKEIGWGMITKIDKKEAYTSIDFLRNFLILLNSGFIIIGFVTSYFIGKYLALPIEELIKSTNKIKEGELNYRMNISYRNELGTLADSFNDMADKLEKKINELDRVGYVISHDLKAPLQTITPLIKFIKEDNTGKLNEESLKMLGMIDSKILQMEELIKEILESARKEKKIKEIINVKDLINNILNNLNPPSNIRIFIQHNLPIVFYHKISLMQVFQNLMGNAIKYMDKTDGLIKIGSREENGHYVFWISDNGPGIKKENQEKIFKMFESANTNERIESTGIGLGITTKIIEENSGKIWVESKQKEGSSFYFSIPKVNN